MSLPNLSCLGMWPSLHAEANQSSAWNIWYKGRWIWMDTQGNLFIYLLTLWQGLLIRPIDSNPFSWKRVLTFYLPSFQWQPEMDTSRRRFFLWCPPGGAIFVANLILDVIFLRICAFFLCFFLAPNFLALCNSMYLLMEVYKN